MDEEALILHSGFLPEWRAGVDAGYRAGWDEAIVDEAAQANPAVTAIAAHGMVGGPAGGPIALLQAVPPQEFIIPEAGEATQHGTDFGHGPGYQDRAAPPLRIFRC